ncbi:MAG TPA: TetR/AcrR family transcriptional regulator [Acidimicrobiales bacterium]|nr:TetR/AcrR family transcriptional regulator [Acidimicrobiales bacterium]
MSVAAVPGEGGAQNAPRSRKGEQTRARLLDAAKEIFEENGFLDARITDIAERAGLSHGAFYHYFDSKEQVFREIAEMLDEYLSEVMETVIFAPGASVDPRERIETALRSHFERYRDEARIMGVIEQVARYDEHVAAVRSARNKLHRGQIEASIRGMQRRGIADTTIDPKIAAAALGSMVERFAEMSLAQGQLDCDTDDAATTVARLFVNALQMKPAKDTRFRS